MIVENQKHKELKQRELEISQEITKLHHEQTEIFFKLRKNPEWLENTAKRIKINEKAMVELMISNNEIVNYFHSNDITTERFGDTFYAYVNYINEEHLQPLLDAGAIIETNENS